MEGFNPVTVDGILILNDKNLTSVSMCPVGFRSSEDTHAAFAKVRLPAKAFILVA